MIMTALLIAGRSFAFIWVIQLAATNVYAISQPSASALPQKTVMTVPKTLLSVSIFTSFTRFVEPKTAEMPEGIAYSGHWAYNNIVTAVSYGWIDDAETIDPDQNVTRGEAVECVNSIFVSCENPT